MDDPERLSLSPNFEISKFMSLSKKTMNWCYQQNNISANLAWQLKTDDTIQVF